MANDRLSDQVINTDFNNSANPGRFEIKDLSTTFRAMAANDPKIDIADLKMAMAARAAMSGLQNGNNQSFGNASLAKVTGLENITPVADNTPTPAPQGPQGPQAKMG